MTRWDDGTLIQCLLKETQTINVLGVSSTYHITMQDLSNYGRDYVTVDYKRVNMNVILVRRCININRVWLIKVIPY